MLGRIYINSQSRHETGYSQRAARDFTESISTRIQSAWQLAKTVLVAFSVFIVIVMLNAPLARAASNCNYYASPTGTGNGLSLSSPFKIRKFWAVASAGKTLCLVDGTYTGSDSMIDPPDNLSGVAGKPITIRALNDGKVTINGQFARIPVYLRSNHYFVLEGFNAHSSSEGVVSLSNANHNIVRRVIAWDAHPDKNTMVFAASYGSDNLFEDVAGWGTGRKVYGLYQDTRTTFRRCFFRWTGTTDTAWKVGHTSSYYSRDSTTENCIGTWDMEPGLNTSQQAAVFGIDHSERSYGNHKFFGNIAYQLRSQTGSVGHMQTIGGFCRGTDQATMTYRDVLAYRDSGVSARGIAIGCKSSGSDYTDTQGGAIKTDGATRTLAQLGGNLLQYSAQRRPTSGAWLRYRYMNGVLTNVLLWPWPMNERIQAAMVASGYSKKGGLDGKGGIDLTKTIFALGGGTTPSLNTSSSVAGAYDNFAPTNLRVIVGD